MFLNDSFVEISWVEAHMEHAIGLPGVGQGRYPLGW